MLRNFTYPFCFIFCRNFFNVITFNFISFYLGVLRDGNPVAGLQIFE